MHKHFHHLLERIGAITSSHSSGRRALLNSPSAAALGTRTLGGRPYGGVTWRVMQRATDAGVAADAVPAISYAPVEAVLGTVGLELDFVSGDVLRRSWAAYQAG